MAEAAQVNAVASDAAASDDSDLRNIVHAGTTLAATTLAVAERTSATGEEVLAAIVLGYEAAGRIGDAITPGFRNQGFHGCLVAIFAGAVAAGRLLGLDMPQMTQAIALSATSIGGLAAAANTSVAREYPPAWRQCWEFMPHLRRSAAIAPKSKFWRRGTAFSRFTAASKVRQQVPA
jgi:2-methylcitrate dehydratase PrpD